MEINSFGKTASSLHHISTTRTEQKGVAMRTTPAETPLAEQVDRVSLGQLNITPLVAPPASVQSIYRVEPPSGNSSWDQSLKDSLHSIGEPAGWEAASGGLGELSVERQFSQRAEAMLMPRAETPEKISDRSTSSLGTMSFSATLASGQVVTFEVHAEAGHGRVGRGSMAFRALEVSYSASEDLTDEERAELEAFSQSLGNFVRDFAADGEPDLSRLKLTELSEIQTIDLRMETKDKYTLSLHYDQGIQSGQQELRMKWNERSLDLQIDNDGSLSGTEPSDISHLRSVLIENLNKAQAEKGDMKVILQTLTLFDSAVGESSKNLPKGSDALLTGLPDYHLSFKGEIEYPMRNTEHGNKFSGIRNLTLSQTTQTTEKNGVTHIAQTQTVDLNAAYFSSLPHLEDPNFERKNFNWHRLDESHQLNSQQTWEGATLDAAILTRFNDINNFTETWSEGVLTNRREDQRQERSIADVRPLIEAAAHLNPSTTNATSLEKLVAAKEAHSRLQELLDPMHNG